MTGSGSPGHCLSTLDKRDVKLFFQKDCFIKMMGGSHGLQGLFWEAGMHLIYFSTPLSIDSRALLLGTIKFLAAETEIAAGFPWSLSKPPLARPMSYAQRDLWVPWKQSKTETFLQNLLTFSTAWHFFSGLALLDFTLLSLRAAQSLYSFVVHINNRI